MRAVARLATYGTLRPGEENHWVVRDIAGEWRDGTVRGWTYTLGFGPAEGYPGFTADPDGPPVAVSVLTTDPATLDRHWREIDDFEGPGYRRVEIDVALDAVPDRDAPASTVRAWIYETDPDAE